MPLSLSICRTNIFPPAGLPRHELAPVVGTATRVIEMARKEGAPVVHIRHEQPGAPLFVPGSDSVEIVPEVAPASGETVIMKNYPNSFR